MSRAAGMRGRVRTLELVFAQLNREIILRFADGKSRTMTGSPTHFFRLVDAMTGNARDSERAAIDERALDDLRRSVAIEGDNAQMFYLLRALALGPAESETNGENNEIC